MVKRLIDSALRVHKQTISRGLKVNSQARGEPFRVELPAAHDNQFLHSLRSVVIGLQLERKRKKCQSLVVPELGLEPRTL